MKLHIAGYIDDSVVDGAGIRFTVFVQGCLRHCPGCHNAETWAENPSAGRYVDTDDLMAMMAENPLLKGVTFSGGEPFLQPLPLVELARRAHERHLDVWTYTGYTYDELAAMTDKADVQALLSTVDVLVDGPYIEAERDLSLRFRGSRNQRVIDMAATRRDGRVVLKYN